MNFEAFYKLSYGLYVISSKSGDKLNGYIANTAFQVTAEPSQVAISCNKNNLSTGIIGKSKVFSISVLEQDTSADLIGLMGYKSGKDIDKFEDLNYITGKTGAPIVLDHAIAWFDCEVSQTIDVGTHIIFVGKVIDSELIDKNKIPLTYDYYRDVKKGAAPKNAPTYIDKSKLAKTDSKFKKYECVVCGHIYDEELGDPDSGIIPETKFEDLPEDWVCPTCGAEKSDFELI